LENIRKDSAKPVLLCRVRTALFDIFIKIGQQYLQKKENNKKNLIMKKLLRFGLDPVRAVFTLSADFNNTL
jgi:hypothetical protein